MFAFAESEKWLQKAKDCHEDADILIDYGKKQGPVSKIYYSAFSCAKALLVLHQIKTVKHASVISLFGRVLIKEKGFNKGFGRFLNDAFHKRKNADYNTSPEEFSRKELKILLKISSDFIQATRDYIDRIKLLPPVEQGEEINNVEPVAL